MNRVDLALLFFALLCVLRGYWRGVFREGFGVVAVVAGVAAACSYAPLAANRLAGIPFPPPVPSGLAFVAIFLVTYCAAVFVGFLVDHLASGAFPRVMSGVMGGLLGVVKAGFIAAPVLLLLRLLPVLPGVPEDFRGSRLAPPLISAATAVLSVGARESGPAVRSGRP